MIVDINLTLNVLEPLPAFSLVTNDLTSIGSIRKASSSDINKIAVGMVINNYLSTTSQSIQIVTFGQVTNSLWNWNISLGKYLYCDVNGQLTQTSSSLNNVILQVGEILTSNTILIDLEEITIPSGASGPTGASGSQGIQGLQGYVGNVGPTGASGSQGIQGIAGVTGPTGAQGNIGVQGIQGLVGPTGASLTGPTGVQGVTGPLGLTGPTGALGVQGVTGPSGPMGYQGVQGIVGPSGPTGTTGPTGVQGVTGPLGLTGPTGGVGVKGPTGPNGLIGATGPTGPIGHTGVTGPYGLTGPQGDPSSIAGPIGATGPTGPTGLDGLASTIPGPTGPQGFTGAAGIHGATGPTGLSITGPTGPKQSVLITINPQVGTTYTLALTDGMQAGSVPFVTLSNASPVTVTIPTFATVAFPVGTQIDLLQDGAGKVTLAGAVGVTINSLGGNKSLAGQYSNASLIKEALDTWYLIGNLIA